MGVQGSRVLGFWGSGFRVSGFGFRLSGSGFTVWSVRVLRFRAQDFEFRVIFEVLA